ncbi:MAG: hypothetical protein DCF31_15060 [Alphaproteobacteria bacterium]|nr:MAG: hypothetical protein DCF31_15060 [Alphaproteobacteria bacterium]
MKWFLVAILAASVALPAGLPAAAKAPGRASRSQLTAEQAADRQVWMDEHARWNAEHMAAARRLEAVVAALKQHDTGFDLHGAELRLHASDRTATETATETVTQAHPRLRTAHEQARNVHDDLMDAVDTLTRVLRKDLGKKQSFPDVQEQP